MTEIVVPLTAEKENALVERVAADAAVLCQSFRAAEGERAEAGVEQCPVFFTQTRPGGVTTTAEIAGLTVTADNMKNGAQAKLAVSAALKLATTTATNSSTLAATLKSSFNLDLNDALEPKSATADATLAVTSGTGDFQDIAQLQTRLAVMISPTEVKQFEVSFTKA